MTIYDWQARYETGNVHIDSEHKIFLGIIRKLANDIEAEENNGRILRTFLEVLKYTEFHFLREENLMQDMEYPGYPDHKKLHEDLLLKLHKSYEELKDHGPISNDIVSFLLDWFIRHTISEDMNIGNFIADNSLNAARQKT